MEAASTPEIDAHAGAGVELRPLAELACRASEGDPTTVRLAQDRRARPRFFLGAEAGADWQMGVFEIELSALLRWQLSHTTYQVREGDQILTVLAPWRLQPGMSITASYIW